MAMLAIRNVFPKPNPEQEAMISASCLALTNDEKTSIDLVSKGLEGYQTDGQVAPEVRQSVDLRIVHTVRKAQIIGAIGGGITGAVLGGGVALGVCQPASLIAACGGAAGVVAAGGLGAAAGYYVDESNKIFAFGGGAVGAVLGTMILGVCKKTDAKVFVVAGAAITGGTIGAIGGYHKGERIGRVRAVSEITASPEFREWKLEKFKVALPALSRAMSRNEMEKIDFTCPITRDWMVEPVRAPGDKHYYEKAALLDHLAGTELTQDQLDALSPEERRQALLNRSPFGICNIQTRDVIDCPTYYDEMLANMKQNYNKRVLEQRAIVAHENPERALTPEEARIIRYNTLTEAERTAIVSQMASDILASQKSWDIKISALALLTAVRQPPNVLA